MKTEQEIMMRIQALEIDKDEIKQNLKEPYHSRKLPFGDTELLYRDAAADSKIAMLRWVLESSKCSYCSAGHQTSGSCSCEKPCPDCKGGGSK